MKTIPILIILLGTIQIVVCQNISGEIEEISKRIEQNRIHDYRIKCIKEYKRWEESKPAFREINKIEKFVEKKDLNWDSKLENSFAKFIIESGIPLGVSWDGPYAAFPRPIAGFLVAEHAKSELNKLEANVPNLINKLKESEDHSQYINIFIEYYQNEILRKNEHIKFMELSDEERLKRIHQQVEEDIERLRRMREGIQPNEEVL